MNPARAASDTIDQTLLDSLGQIVAMVERIDRDLERNSYPLDEKNLGVLTAELQHAEMVLGLLAKLTVQRWRDRLDQGGELDEPSLNTLDQIHGTAYHLRTVCTRLNSQIRNIALDPSQLN